MAAVLFSSNTCVIPSFVPGLCGGGDHRGSHTA
jgi:hypothetical protein